ncbi:MAG: hypothetical protein ACT4OU_01585 [Hyphomicrobium sp.]
MWPSAFVDASGAAPWVAGGFVAGLFVYAMVRAASGVDRGRIAALSAATAKVEGLQSAKSALETDLAQASARAALAGRLEQEFAGQDGVHRQLLQLQDGAQQLSLLRGQLESQAGAAQYYQDELRRVAAKHEEFRTASYAELSGMTKRLAELSDRLATERALHGEDIARFQSQIAAAAQSGIDPELYESEVAALSGAIDDLRAEASAQSAEMAGLRAQIVATPPEGIDPELYESEVATLASTIDDLRVELTARQGEILALTAQIAAAPTEGIDPELYESEVAALLSAVKDLRVELSASQNGARAT